MSILYPPLPDYPVKSSFSTLEPMLKNNALLALEAPTGSGKTTLLPLLIHRAGLFSKKILLTQPRRLAAKSVAQRMAQLTGTKIGDLVGYRLRGESRVSSETRIEVVTEGYALAILQADPFMSDYDWVIIDEFHERHIEGDLLLAFMRDLRSSLGPDDSPGLILMTATWQGQPREALTDFCFKDIKGRLYPVQRVFSKQPSKPEQNLQPRLEQAVTQAANDNSGKILVFLPGRREIEDAYRHFSVHKAEYELSPLYGGMKLSEQQKVLNYTGSRRQVILSTAIAETSLTIEGVTAVVDSGLERLPLYQPNLGLTRLVTRRVSRATAVQRAGRAGRLGPGSCFSLWTEAEEQTLVNRWDPEIITGELSSARLQTAVWGSDKLPWITLPPEGLWLQAGELLRELEAIDGEYKITERGRSIASLPLPPRLAHMVVSAPDRSEAAHLAAILSEGHRFRLEGSSVSEQLRIVRSRAEFEPLRREAGEIEARVRMAAVNTQYKSVQNHSIGGLLSLAFPDRIGRRKGIGSYELITGSSVICRDCSAEWAVFPEMSGSGDRLIGHSAEALSLEEIRDLHPGLFSIRNKVSYHPETGKFKNLRAEYFNKLIMKTLPAEEPTAAERFDALKMVIKKRGLDALPINKAGRNQLERLKILEEAGITGLPSGRSEMLIERLKDWLLPWLNGDLSPAVIIQALDARLSWDQKNRLETLLPRRIRLRPKQEKTIDYSNPAQPLIRGRLQEFFGLTAILSIAEGRITIAVELLSPAMRPLQTTSDLSAFWAGSYQQIRGEMRGRYPKHYWPEDPATAEPSLATGKNRPD